MYSLVSKVFRENSIMLGEQGGAALRLLVKQSLLGGADEAAQRPFR